MQEAILCPFKSFALSLMLNIFKVNIVSELVNISVLDLAPLKSSVIRDASFWVFQDQDQDRTLLTADIAT